MAKATKLYRQVGGEGGWGWGGDGAGGDGAGGEYKVTHVAGYTLAPLSPCNALRFPLSFSNFPLSVIVLFQGTREHRHFTSQWEETQKAFSAIGISADQIKGVWTLLAIIFHLGAANALKVQTQGMERGEGREREKLCVANISTCTFISEDVVKC